MTERIPLEQDIKHPTFTKRADINLDEYWYLEIHTTKPVELMEQITSDYNIVNQTTKILSNHCGETGKNEGLIETLERLSDTVNKLKERMKNKQNGRHNRQPATLHYEAIIQEEFQKIWMGE